MGVGLSALAAGHTGPAVEALAFLVRTSVEDVAARAAHIRQRLQARMRGR